MTEEGLLALAASVIKLFREAEDHRLICGCSIPACHDWFRIQNEACLAAIDFEVNYGKQIAQDV